MRPTRSRRVAGRDRMWTFASTTRTIGRFDDLRRERLVEALRRLAVRSPEHRLFFRLDDDRRRWLLPATGEHAALIDRAVLEWEPLRPEQMHQRLSAVVLDDLPWRFVICGDLVGVRLRHMFADGIYIGRMFAALTGAAQTGRLPDGFVAPPTPLPLPRAALAQARWSTGRALSAALRTRAKAPAGDLEPVPADIEQRAAHVLAAPELFDELTRLRSENPARPSINALLVARLRTAMKEAGIPLSDTTTVLFGARRYLSEHTNVEGNFAIPLPVRPAEPDDPAQLTAAIAGVTRSALPLVAVARGAVLAGRLDAGSPPPSVRRLGQPMLVHSLLPMDAAHRWFRRRAEDPVLLVSGPPPGLGALTINTFVFERRIHFCASYYRSGFDEPALTRALASAACVPESSVGTLSVASSLGWAPSTPDVD